MNIVKPLKIILSSSIALSIALAGTTLAALPVSASQTTSHVVMSAIPSINPGGTVTITGTSTDSEVIVKVIRPTGSVLFFDIVKVTNGAFSDSFVLGSSELAGTYKVVAGQANTVDTKDLIVIAPVTPPETPPDTPPDTPPETPPVVTPDKKNNGHVGASVGNSNSNVVTNGNVQINPNAVISNKITGPDGKVTTTVTIDNKVLSDSFSQLNNQENTEGTPVIAIHIGSIDPNGKTNVAIPASVLVEGMKSVPNAVIQITSGKESYSLPLQVLDFESIAQSLGADSSSITLHVNITVIGTDIEKQIQETANQQGVCDSKIHLQWRRPPVHRECTRGLRSCIH